ncbi:MAG TPA: hypothetical protein GX705_00290 [Clostridiales bacterium]|nr:hypothetical protein [Clostridiales bacterium]
MGARKLNNRYDKYYTEGNAVRRVRPDSDVYENPLREERRRQSKRSSRKSQKELSSINMASCVILIFAITITLFTCIDFIKIQAEVSSLNTRIIQSEKELSNLKDENIIRKAQLDASVDLNEIYDVASNELGMVVPNDDQVIYFESVKSGFVKQYENIPASADSNLFR